MLGPFTKYLIWNDYGYVKIFTKPGPTKHPGKGKHTECAQIISQFVLKPGNDNNILTSRDFLEIYPTLGFSPAPVSTYVMVKSRIVRARVES